MSPKCVEVGDANPDVARIGIILSFTIQAGISIVISYFLEFGTARSNSDQDVTSYQKKLKIANTILLQGGDVQVITGISLLLTAIIQLDSLPFYHLHIIYDTVSFVGISLCASIVCSFSADMGGKIIRYTMIAIWGVLYLVYASLFGTHLKSWNYNVAGHCYDTSKIALPNASHPYVDNIYLSVTCLYVFTALAWALLRRFNTKTTEMGIAYMVLSVAAFQFPLHVYSKFTLRSVNEPLLTSGGSERQWGFGQIVAMVLLANNVIILLNGIEDYSKKSTNNKAAQTAATVAQDDGDVA